MRFLIKTVFSLFLLLVLGIGALLFLVPTEAVRDQIIATIKHETGRDLTVVGETSFSFYPNVGVRLGDVSLSNPPEIAGGPMVSMAALEIGLKFAPLLTRDVEVERFVLVRPVFDLRVDAAGRKNWEFKQLAEVHPARDEGIARRPRRALAQSAGSGAFIRDIRLGDVRIEEGVVQFTDDRSGASQKLEAINATLAMKRLDEPLGVQGDLVWQGEKITVDGRVDSLRALADEEASPVRIALQSAYVTGTFDGRARIGEALLVDGQLAVDSPSVRGLADWIGSNLPPGGFGAAKIAGDVEATADQVAFEKLRLTLDGMTGEGKASVRFAGAKPYLRAAMAFDKIDLNPYIGAGATAAGPRSSQVPKSTSTITRDPAPSPQPEPSLTDFIEKLNKEDGKAVRGWSQTAFDFAALAAVDADVNLTAGQILYRQIKVGQSAVTAALKNGLLTADLNDLRLYDGRGTGRLKLDGLSAAPQLAVRLDLENVLALPILKDAMQFDWLSGRANLAVALSGAGRSESELVRSLQGNGNLAFADGAIEGINIPKMVRGLKNGQFSGWQRLASEKTDFSSLTGTFTMQNGVARNEDLKLIGPLVRLAGAGTVDLPAETLDYDVEPRVVASLEGQGADGEGSGLVLPFRVHGPWDRPRVTPDLKRLLENPDQAIDTVKKIGEAVKKLKNNKDFGNALRNFLGQQPGAPATPAPDVQAPATPDAQPGANQGTNTQDAIRQFFRQ